MDGCDFDPRQPGWGRDTRADDEAAVRWAVGMTAAGLASIVGLVILMGAVNPVENEPASGRPGSEMAL